MKKWMTLTTAAAVTALTLSTSVDASRMGSGKSVGKQSPSVMQRDATPPAQTAPNAVPPTTAAQPSAAARAPAAGAAQAAQQTGRSRWMAPLAGIAAGLGLAWLANSLGFGEELATALLIGLIVMAVLVLWRVLRARRGAAGPQPAYAGHQTNRMATDTSTTGFSAAPGAAAGGYAGALGSAAAAGQPASARLSVPAGFDTEAFVRNAKQQFMQLQAAFDAGDLARLREFTSPEMFEQLKGEIGERHGAANVTEVVTLNAVLLGIETDAREHTASVRFTGVVREQVGAQPVPLDEVWNLTKPVSGNEGWVLAGIQQMA